MGSKSLPRVCTVLAGDACSAVGPFLEIARWRCLQPGAARMKQMWTLRGWERAWVSAVGQPSKV